MSKCSQCKFYTEDIEKGILGRCDILEQTHGTVSNSNYRKIESYWMGEYKKCPLFEEK